MSSKIWLATGEYTILKKIFKFSRELLAPKEEHVREKVYSELGSRHKVRRKYIKFTEIKEIKPEDVKNLDLRKTLGLESEI